MTNFPVFQGDVGTILLSEEQVAKLNKYITEKKIAERKPETLILAYGESTGHYHQIESGVEAAWEVETDVKELNDLLGLDFLVDEANRVLEKEKFNFFRVRDTDLIHRNVKTGDLTNDHGVAPLTAGTYLCINQEEYHFGMYQRVID